MNYLLSAFERNPIIAAVKDEEQLQRALESDCEIIFLLCGTICNIAGYVQAIHDAGKLALVHLDLVHGLSGKDVAVDFIKFQARADGVISTRPTLLRYAKSLGLITVLRLFLVDSMSLDNLDKQLEASGAAMVEIMPGLMPKIIRQVCRRVRVPVITGGLVVDKEDVFAALSAGAMCVSTTREELWQDQ